ncbi:hypothetical protein [Actinokineospora sp.]|uniref:hypothetical protein n=1 Tax=Actinokineospora sp. TaxID=1872133 RepID=UPI004037CFDF
MTALAVGLVAVPAGSAQAADHRVQLDAAVRSVLAASPSDADLSDLSDVAVASKAVRCVSLDERTYCLQLGWVDAAPTAAELSDRVRSSDAASERSESAGDLPFADQVRLWAAKSAEQRLADERSELDAARAALGKVKLYDYWIAGKSVPEEFWARYPETVAWGKSEVTTTGADSEFPRYFSVATTGDPNRGQKQSTSHYCGPTSMVAFAWNDPLRGNELSPANGFTQQLWARDDRLKTDAQRATAISDLKDQINEHLTWKNRVGPYIVISNATWETVNWQNMWRDHFGRTSGTSAGGAPVQLHVVLNPTNNSFGMRTGGHLNVGRGYDFDPNKPTWRISVYEPAGGSTVPVSYWETHQNVIEANENHPQRNIAI